MGVRAFLRSLRVLSPSDGGAESTDDAQLAEIQREVERGLEALRRLQQERAAAGETAEAAPADPCPPEAEARATCGGG
jgi:hypothetical protein